MPLAFYALGRGLGMGFLNKISISVKIWIVVSLMATGIGIVAYAGLSSAAKLSDSMAKVSGGTVLRMEKLAMIGLEARQTRTRHFQYLAATSDDKREKLLAGIDEAAENVRSASNDYLKLSTDPVDKANAEKMLQGFNDYVEAAKPIKELSEPARKTRRLSLWTAKFGQSSWTSSRQLMKRWASGTARKQPSFMHRARRFESQARALLSV